MNEIASNDEVRVKRNLRDFNQKIVCTERKINKGQWRKIVSTDGIVFMLSFFVSLQ